jgi:hypothetical protein
MKKIFVEAHKMTREMVKKYEVDYQVQFGLCLSYLLNEEEEEMINFSKKGLKFEVEVTEKLTVYLEGKAIGESEYINKLEKNNLIAFNDEVKAGPLKGMLGITVDEKVRNEILGEYEDNKNKIDKYFNEIEELEIEKIGHRNYYILGESHKEIEKLNEGYFFRKKEEWIRNNKRNFMLKDELTEAFESQTRKIYIYKKGYEKETAKKATNNNSSRYNKLYEEAEKMTDEEFEDIYGVKREGYIA